MSELKLNVIFHGTFVFCKNKVDNRIDVYIPKVPNHIFKAGNWLGETDLVGGGDVVYELKLPQPALRPPLIASVTLPVAHNLVVNRPHSSGLSSLLHAKLVMPLPENIVTPRRAPVPNTKFKHINVSDPVRAQPLIDLLLAGSNYQGNLGSVTVFTYPILDVTGLRLVRLAKPPAPPEPEGAHPWIPVPSGPTPPLPAGAVNLHIFAAHEVEEDLEEAATAFDQMAKLFNGFPLELKRTNINAELQIDDLPDGVSPEECEDLSLRFQRLAKLGRMRRNRLDLNQLWFESESFDSEPSACGCCWCC